MHVPMSPLGEECYVGNDLEGSKEWVFLLYRRDSVLAFV